MMSRSNVARAALATLVVLCLSTPALASRENANFETDPGNAGGGGQGGPLQVTPATPVLPGDPPAPVDTLSFVWTGSASLFFFPDASGGNVVTSTPEGGPGTVTVRRRDGGLFEFGGVDYAYSTLDTFLGDEALRVQGFRNGSSVATGLFVQTIANAGNYSSFGPGALEGVMIDELQFDLDNRRIFFDEDLFPQSGRFSTSIRNIVFADAGASTPGAGAIPEPSTWALMIGGFGLAGAALRRRAARTA